VGSLGVAASQNIAQLMVWRFVQALGASPGLAVGSGVIGDIYKLEERGQAMGIFFGVRLSSPSLRMPFPSEFLGYPSGPCSRPFGRG